MAKYKYACMRDLFVTGKLKMEPKYRCSLAVLRGIFKGFKFFANLSQAVS